MEKPPKIADAERRRATIRMRNLVLGARERWQKYALENIEAERSVGGQNKYSQKKILYIARHGEWFDKVEKEMGELNAKIARAIYADPTEKRLLWLPTIIDNPEMITLKINRAVSVKEVLIGKAKEFTERAQCKDILPENTIYVIKTVTGAAHKLEVKHKENKISRVPFTKWALCICRDKLPLLKRRKKQVDDVDSIFKDAICVYKKSALFIKADATLSEDDI